MTDNVDCCCVEDDFFITKIDKGDDTHQFMSRFCFRVSLTLFDSVKLSQLRQR
ncbi:hypothetical protein Hanom_Chr04g00344511 [Helianthus anomalus]